MSGYSGSGSALGHAGEVLQGTLGNECFLVTIPAPIFRSTATLSLASEWSIWPPTKLKALRAVQIAAGLWAQSQAWEIRIVSTIPEGCGCGSSTSDCVAAVRALGTALDRACTAEEIAAIVHEAEAASDPTMYDLAPVLFLPRRGVLVRRLDGAWPAAHVTVCDLGGPPVDTLSAELPREHPEYRSLLTQLEIAFSAGDLQAIANVATASALLHQAATPLPAWDDLYRSAMIAGALGVAIAHTGNIAAVLSRQPLKLPALYRYRLGE